VPPRGDELLPGKQKRGICGKWTRRIQKPKISLKMLLAKTILIPKEGITSRQNSLTVPLKFPPHIPYLKLAGRTLNYSS